MLSEAECYIVYVYSVGVAARLKLLDRTEKKRSTDKKKNKKSLEKKSN